MKQMKAKRYLVGRLLLAIFAITCLAYRAGAARDMIDGEEKDLWQNHSLLYARVKAVMRQTNSILEQYTVTIEPVATLGGRFDCSSCAQLGLNMYTGIVDSTIPAPPEPGSKVVILIQERKAQSSEVKGRLEYFAWGAYVMFMPSGAECITVSGIDDRVIGEIMEKLRAARAKSSEKAGP